MYVLQCIFSNDRFLKDRLDCEESSGEQHVVVGPSTCRQVLPECRAICTEVLAVCGLANSQAVSGRMTTTFMLKAC